MLHILNALLIGAAIGLFCVGAKQVFSKIFVGFIINRKNKKTVTSRAWLIDVEASPMKAIDFLEGGIDGRLVVFGPFNGIAKRTLLLWKNGKHRCIRMDVVVDAKPETMEAFYRDSVVEAKAIAIKVFAKRKSKPHPQGHAPPQVEETKPVQAQPAKVEVIRLNANVAETKPVCSAPQPAVSSKEERDIPIIKGFKAQYVGEMVKAKVEPHVKTGFGGTTEEFMSFTLTLRTDGGGLEQIIGNDLKRAISSADAEEGDRLRVIHMDNTVTPSGFSKKSFQIINLTKAGRTA